MDAGSSSNAFQLPPAQQHIRTGSLLDVFPILSLVACLPTLRLFLMSRRRSDLFIYTVGFLVAILYHFLQVHKPGGLGATSWMGLPGAGWRIVDIIFADLMLARSTAHILGISHPFIASLPNVVLPCFLVGLLIAKPGCAGLEEFTLYTGACVLLTIAIQLLVDARAIVRHAVTHYSPMVMARTVFFCVLGFSCFVVPVKYPGDYWFWHSAWHVCMGLAYFEVYAALCGLPGSSKLPGRLAAPGRGRAAVEMLLGDLKPRHWMASSRSKGGTSSPHVRPILGSQAEEEAQDRPAPQPAAPALAHGRQAGRRRSGPSSLQQAAAVVSPPPGQGRRGRSRGQTASVGGGEAASPGAAGGGALGSPKRARGGRGRERSGSRGRKAAADGDAEVAASVATPSAPRRRSKGGLEVEGWLAEEPGSIAQRVRARRRRSGGE